MNKYTVSNSLGKDTLVMVTIRNTTQAGGLTALQGRLNDLGVQGTVQYLTGVDGMDSRFIWGYKVGTRTIRSVISGASVASFAVLINANDVHLEVINSETCVDENGNTYELLEIESLNEKLIRGVGGASCSSFRTAGENSIEVEVGIV